MNKTLSKWLVLLVGLGACLHFALSYQTLTNPYLDLPAYVAGTERLPFQYRILSAILLRVLAHNPLLQAVATHAPAPFDTPLQTASLLLNTVSIFLAVYFTFRTIRTLTHQPTFSLYFSFVVLYMASFHYMLSYGLWRLSYPYDLPQLALFALAFYFIVSKRWLPFTLVFLVATLNKETAIFLIPLLWLYHAQDGERRQMVVYSVLCLVGFAVIKVALFRHFSQNAYEEAERAVSGGLFVWQLALNVKNLLSPQYWPKFLSIFGFAWLFLLPGWGYLSDPRLKRSLGVLLPWFMVMMIAGRIPEIRLFGELIPLMAVALSTMAFNFLGGRVENADRAGLL